MKVLWSLTFICLALSGPAPVHAVDVKPLDAAERKIFLTQMHNVLSSVHSIKTNITQKRVLKVFMDELLATGILYFKLPDRLRWETSAPYKTIVIYNDKQVAKFNFEDGKWRKLDFGAADLMGEVMSNIIDWTRGKFDGVEETYDLQVYPGYKLRLQPKVEAMARSLSSIELSINPKTFKIETVRLNEPKGGYVEITFSHSLENIELSDDLFNLKSPST